MLICVYLHILASSSIPWSWSWRLTPSFLRWGCHTTPSHPPPVAAAVWLSPHTMYEGMKPRWASTPSQANAATATRFPTHATCHCRYTGAHIMLCHPPTTTKWHCSNLGRGSKCSNDHLVTHCYSGFLVMSSNRPLLLWPSVWSCDVTWAHCSSGPQ
jgi:hypothetical protein